MEQEEARYEFKQEESVKFSRGAFGKYGYEFKLLGDPKKNLDRVKELKEEFDKLVVVM